MEDKFHYRKRKIAIPQSSVFAKMLGKDFDLVSYFSSLFLGQVNGISFLVTAGAKSMDVLHPCFHSGR